MPRKIDDHAFFAGKGSGHPLAEGVKSQKHSSAEGAGGLAAYNDTSPDIKSMQEANVSSIKSQLQPVTRRN